MTRSSIVPASVTSQKRTLPPSRSVSTKAKKTKKRKRPVSQQSSKIKGKTRTISSDDENDEEEDEEEEEEEEEEEDDDEDDEDFKQTQSTNNPKTRAQLTKKSTPTRSSRSSTGGLSEFITSTNHVHSIDNDEDNTENIDNTDTTSNNRLPPPTIGARVWAMYQGARRPGKVLSVNDKRGIFKMRFDEFPTAEFDYSFSYKSPVWSYTNPAQSSSTETKTDDNEPLFTISRKFKALLKVLKYEFEYLFALFSYLVYVAT